MQGKEEMIYEIECPDKDYDLILKEYKEIPLTQGKVALVDTEDYDYLNQWKWFTFKCRNTNYATRKYQGKMLLMHRYIMKPSFDMQIDHINMDGLDNRRDNLRICYHVQNLMNTKKHFDNTSGYKGVCYHKLKRKWVVRINVNKKQIHLGYFIEKEDAALVYNEAALKYHGEFARLNCI